MIFMKITTLKIFIITLLTFVFIVFSCTKDDEEASSDAISIALISGDNQIAEAGVTLENPIEVLVKDQFGHPFAETVVHFTPSDGLVSLPTVKTDARGITSVLWTVGSNSGEQTLIVTAFKTDGTTPLKGSPFTVTANAEGEAISKSLALVSGGSQTAQVETALANPVTVQVKDTNGNPFTGATVNFATTDGSVSAASGVSDANGNVSVNWTLGATVGTQNLTVTGFKADGTTPLDGSPMTVTATGTSVPAFADILQKVSGDSQSGTVNEALSNPIVVRVLDQFENPFAGATVNFVTTDGSISATSGVSDSNGNVSVNWTLGATVGTQNLAVTAFKADGTTPLDGSAMTITADAQAALGADILQKVSGDGQTGTVNTVLANPIVVRVLDQFENPFTGATVNFATSDGSVSASSGISDVNGNVSVNWTLGSTTNSHMLTVTAFKADGTTPLDGSPMTITAVAEEALEATGITMISGDDQSGLINTVLPDPIVVRVFDQFEQPFSGVTVHFSANDGTVSATAVTTDANGNAQVNWTLGSLIGTNNLTVTAFKSDGTTPLQGSPMTIFANAQAPLAIGDYHAGGIIFYLDNTGDHGLVCAITDQASNAEWGCNDITISGADGTLIGTGAQNTQDILADCLASLTAAEWCSNLNSEGYSDWFLPSKDELDELINNKSIINSALTTYGGTAINNTIYWSSSEIDINSAYANGAQNDNGKNNLYSVRAVRAF